MSITLNTTALDRYRQAKRALDTFDAFTKRLAFDSKFKVSAEASMTAATKLGDGRGYDSPTYTNGGAHAGFSRFCADWILNERIGLAAEYRATLVEEVKAAKFAADAEARALIIEVTPT